MIITPPPLQIGERLQVRLDEDNAWSAEWTDVVVQSYSVCFHPRITQELAPYVCVVVNHPKLTLFNFTFYAQQGLVRRPVADEKTDILQVNKDVEIE